MTLLIAWSLMLVPVGFLLGREVVRVHREITASHEATEQGLRAEAERRREAAR